MNNRFIDDLSKCMNCGKFDESTQKCSGCYHVFYCSTKCQRNDWPNHKKICKMENSSKKSLKNKRIALQNHVDNITKFVNNNVVLDLEPLADKLAADKKIAILNGLVPVPLSYDDGDQSPLKSQDRDAQILRIHWASGLDILPFMPEFHYLSEWMKVIWSGDYTSFLKMIESKSDKEVKKLMSRRETLCNISAIFFVIHGARVLFSNFPQFSRDKELARINLNVKNEHIKILEKLLSLGCDVNARDFAGYSPLHHCCTMYGNEVTLKMAKRLIRAGADVNAKNRFGYTAIMEISMAHNRYDIFSFLLENGANPYLECNEGYSPLTMARGNPKMMELIGKTYRTYVRQKRDKADAFWKCEVCQRSDKSNKKCAGCYHVWYCSSKCQRNDWPHHKIICKEIETEYVRFNYADISIDMGLNFEGKVIERVPGTWSKKSHFIVKIQTPLTDHFWRDQDYLVVYNKDKSFYGSILEKRNNKKHFQELFSKIKTEGYNAVKGYFHMKLLDDGSNGVMINSRRILPLEDW